MKCIEELYVVLVNHITKHNIWKCVGTYITFDQAINSVHGYIKCMHFTDPDDYVLDAAAGDDLNKYYLTSRETGEIILEFCVKQVFQKEHSRLF